MDISEASPGGGVAKLARMLSVLLMLIGGYLIIMRMESAFDVLCMALAGLALTGVVGFLLCPRRREGVKLFRTVLGCMILLLVEYSTLMYFYITKL